MLILCDGISYWDVCDDEAERFQADPARTPFDDLASSRSLIALFRLDQTGATDFGGRPAIVVRGEPRLPAGGPSLVVSLLDWADLLVDAELGVVLRKELSYGGQAVSVVELRDFTIDPPAALDEASFRPADGIDVKNLDCYPPRRLAPDWHADDSDDSAEIGAGWFARTGARLAVRQTARKLARPEPAKTDELDDEPTMPQPGPVPDRRKPLTDDALRVIAQAGRPPLNVSAELHQWITTGLAKAAGFTLGENAETPLAGCFSNLDAEPWWRAHDAHRIASVRLAAPDRYRMTYRLDDRPRLPVMVACDGQRLLKIFHNRIVAGPAEPAPGAIARPFDPAWLLDHWELKETGPEEVNGRRAVGVIAEPPPRRLGEPERPGQPVAQLMLLIDAELGIVLRQVAYLDGEPAMVFETRDVVVHVNADPAEFDRRIAPGLPLTESGGGLAADLDLPPALRATAEVGGDLLSGAQSALGWLSARLRQ
jgi:hypothetical protein